MFHDAITFADARRTADGYLVAEAKVARTGIQVYTGAEVGRPDMATVRVYRPEASVFDEGAMRTFAHRPVTVGHPNEQVTADNWREHAVGQTAEPIVRDGGFVRVPLVLMDASAIRAVEDGVRELSMGYTAELEFGDGLTPEGEPYDAVQKNLRMNHLAIVARARGGSNLRLGDKESDMADAIKTRTVLVDGLSVETTDAGATAIEKLKADMAAERKALADAQTEHAKALAAKDAAIAKLEAERDAAKAKVLDDAALDARVQARATLIADAKAIAPQIDPAGKTDADIRKAAVAAKLGDAAISGKSDAYIDARFDILLEDAKADPVRKALGDGRTAVNANDAEAAYAEMQKSLSTAWNKGAA